MEHGLKYIAFYVQKHITPRVVSSQLPAGSRQAVGVPASVKLVYRLWGMEKNQRLNNSITYASTLQYCNHSYKYGNIQKKHSFLI